MTTAQSETPVAMLTAKRTESARCPYIKLDGRPCDRGMRPGFDRCAVHRPRGLPREFAACSSCGVPTRRIVEGEPLCAGPQCGRNAYLRDRRARIRAATAIQFAPPQNLPEELAAEEDRRTEVLFDELADALAGLKPWPVWAGQTRDEFEAEGERAAASQAAELEAFAAIRADEERQAAAAEVLAAIQAAELETAAADERQRSATAQLARLRSIYNSTIVTNPRRGR
jgi:hypothetical protein